MIPSKPSLEIYRIGWANRSVGGELNRRPLHKRARGHDDLGVIPRHGPRHRGHVAVDGSRRLNALAERQHPLRASELNGLNDIVPRLRAARNDVETEPLIHVRRENRALERAGDDRGRKEEALIEAWKQAQIRADLLPQSGSRKPIRAALDTFLCSADIPTDGRKPATWVFDQAADDHVRAQIGRLDGFHKLAVAVIDHAGNARLDRLAERDELADFLHGVRRSCRVPLRALDGDELRLFRDRRADAVIIKRSVREQIDLPVAHAVLLERALGLADADDLLERVIRRADGAQQLVSGKKIRRQRDG